MSKVSIDQDQFGSVKKYTLSTGDGFQVTVIEYGATIQSIRQSDRNHEIKEITLGYDSLQEYIDDKCYFGCTVGRVTNRIKNARFQLDGIEYQLEKNDQGKHHLHGVFNKRIWTSAIENDDTVVFQYQSPDGEDGFPGEVDVTVKYRLTVDHRLIIDYQATTNKPTPINLTNHTYFNLTGDMSQTVLDHYLAVPSSFYTPLDDEHIPTGEIASVNASTNDFRQMARIGDRIGEVYFGYNVMFIVDGHGQRSFGKLVDKQTGRALTVESSQNALQFYTGTYLNQIKGRQRAVYNKYSGLCLETQNFTDSVNNQPQFPSVILRPNEVHRERTIFHFFIE